MSYLWNLPGQIVVDPNTKEEWEVEAAGDSFVRLIKRRTIHNDQAKYWKIKEEETCNCKCCCCK